jgi:hypothetical protein
MNPNGYRSINTRQLPGAPGPWLPHPRGPLPGDPPTLRAFLDEIADCEHVDRVARSARVADVVPGVTDESVPSEWWAENDDVARQRVETEATSLPADSDGKSWGDRLPPEEAGGGGAPSPVVAFIPDGELTA